VVADVGRQGMQVATPLAACDIWRPVIFFDPNASEHRHGLSQIFTDVCLSLFYIGTQLANVPQLKTGASCKKRLSWKNNSNFNSTTNDFLLPLAKTNGVVGQSYSSDVQA